MHEVLDKTNLADINTDESLYHYKLTDQVTSLCGVVMKVIVKHHPELTQCQKCIEILEELKVSQPWRQFYFR